MALGVLQFGLGRSALRPSVRCLLAAWTGLLLGACDDNREPVGSAATQAEFECVQAGFACTWSEVDSTTVERTIALAWEGMERLAQGASINDVVAALGTEEDLAGLMTDGRVVRFWVSGGRPIWIADRHTFAPDTRSLPTLQEPVQQGEVVKREDESPPGSADPKKPTKRALHLSPYEFEFRGTLSGADVLRGTKDYACEGCVVSYENDYPRSTDANMRVTNSTLNYGVTLEQFKDWDDYSIIHVETHGVMLCPVRAGVAQSSAHCVTALFTGRALTADFQGPPRSTSRFRPSSWSDARGNSGFSLEGTDPGIEFVMTGPSVHCPPEPGDPTPSTWHVEPGAGAAEELGCGSHLFEEVVTDDFFFAMYPNGLPDRIIFLNLCESMLDADRSLAMHLIGGGSSQSSAILGWDIEVPNGVARQVSRTFFQFLLGKKEVYINDQGKPAERWNPPGGLWVGDAIDSTRARLPTDTRHLVAEPSGSTLPGSSTTARGAPTGGGNSWSGRGTTRKRGREIVRLMDAEGRLELEDGATVTASGTLGDNEADELELTFVVDGIGPDQDPSGFALHLSIDGRPSPGEHRLERYVDGAWQVTTSFDVGPLSAGDEFDLEPWVEIPGGGGESRWVYEDLTPAACSFEATVSGARNGTFTGPARFSLKYGSLGIELSNTGVVIGGGSSEPAVSINFGVPDLTDPAPGSYELPAVSMAHVADDNTWSAFYRPSFDEWTGTLRIDEAPDGYVVGRATATLPEITDNGLVAVNLDVTFRAAEGETMEFDEEAPYWQCFGGWL